MLKNYFKIAYRNLLKNKVFSLVNILGLAIGMAACFFIFLYVHFELSYDRFHKNAARLYRVPITFGGSLANNGTEATNHPGVGPAMKADFPEVADYARVMRLSVFIQASMMSYNNGSKTITFNEDRIFVADPSFLTLFSFPFLEGDPKTALSDGQSIVISNKMAKKYFGNEDPLGKTLSLNQQQPFKVTGVFREVPENSHLKFDMLLSFKIIPPMDAVSAWTWPEFYNYVLLAPGADPKKLESKFPAFIDKHMGAILKKFNFSCQFQLQPIRDIHLRSNMLADPEANGSEREVFFLSIIGVFILIIAWINYINLSTAKSVERAKEVGIRKVVGAAKIQLVLQFIMESLLINLLALSIAAILILICYPYFGTFTGANIQGGSYIDGLFSQPLFWMGVAGVFVTGAFLVGAYPAFILSAFRPILVLKGRLSQSIRGILLRKTLVSFQFVLSILLIAGAITVYSQLFYMRSQALGYNKDHVVILKAPAIYDSTISEKIEAFKNELLKNPSVSAVSASTEIPGKAIIERNSARKADQDETYNFTPFLMGIDADFLKTYQLKLAAGRGFLPHESSTFKAENTKVLVNEEVVKGMGYTSNEAAINQPIIFRSGPGTVKAEIIGVISNYHQRSLKQVYDPILYYYPTFSNWNYISVHFTTAHIDRELASFETTYSHIFTGNAFDYFFLGDYFNRQYQADQRFGDIFSLFTAFAIFVACLGLLGLSSFVIKLRTKEIGIRKVLGASISSLLLLFSKDFIKLVCLASVIAIPVIYFMASRWLNNYAFHIQLNWMIFILPPFLLLVISLSTICLQSLQAALTNPVKSLHTE
jgi:putative ABC transport system permease protein